MICRAMNRGQILRNLVSCGAGGRDADWVSGTVLSLRLIRPNDFMSALLHNQDLASSRQR